MFKGQPGFYFLIWAHKVRFSGGEVSSNPKKKKSLSMLTDTIWVIYDYIVSSHFTQISIFSSFGIQGHVTIYTWRDNDINSLAQ
jgi:hypothetical protein